MCYIDVGVSDFHSPEFQRSTAELKEFEKAAEQAQLHLLGSTRALTMLHLLTMALPTMALVTTALPTMALLPRLYF